MAYAQIRVRSISASDMTSTEIHNARRYAEGCIPENIDPKRSNNNTIHYNKEKYRTMSLEETIYNREKELNVKGIKKNSIHAIEVVVSISDAAFFEDYSLAGYASNEQKWLEDEYFGVDNVLLSYLHTDEGKYHVHFICIPAKEKEIKWKNRNGEGTHNEFRLCAQDIIGGREKLSELQTRYYEHCNARYGHIVPFFRGLKAEDQKRVYTQKTNHLLDQYRAKGKEITTEVERTELIMQIDSTIKTYGENINILNQRIEKQNRDRQRPGYNWQHGFDVEEWKGGRHM